MGHPHPNENLFKAYLLTECAYSGFEPQGGERISAELASHTRLLTTIVTCTNCLLFALVLLFSFTQKTALSSNISRFRSLVFCVWKPCGCSTSDCDVLLRSSHTKRSGIIREMPLSMRAPSVAPCGAVPWVPSSIAQRGNGIGETHEEGGNCILS